MTRYYQIGINKTETRRAFGRFITQNWNSQFYDDRNKFVNEGSKLIREVHKSTWDALVVKYKNEIKRRNYHNLRSTKDKKAHSISSLSFTVRPFEINRIVSQELIRSVSTPTIKSYIKRLEKTGVLKILSKNGQKWFIELNKNLVLLFDKYSQKQLTNSKWL